jgi:hypothetical protein
MNRRQTIPKNLRYTRNQFDAEFPNDDVCLETIKEQRFPGGVAPCKKCGVERKHYRVSGRTAYACDHCGNHIYPLAGTIFEKSTNVPPCLVSGDVPHGFHSLRHLRKTDSAGNRSYLQNGVAYVPRLKNHGFTHHRINHSAKVYVMGDIHTNTIEGFWSLVKRGIGGVYHAVSQKYLQSYLDEYCFRYNRRDQGNLIFTSILERVSEKVSVLPSVKLTENPVE